MSSLVVVKETLTDFTPVDKEPTKIIRVIHCDGSVAPSKVFSGGLQL